MTLAVSEMFYSIQGEGVYAGQPSVFLRLQHCNLTCGGAQTVKSKQLDSGATWRCDTIEIWTTGKRYEYKELCDQWSKNSWIDSFKQGAHLIITGGEPLLQHNQLTEFLTFFQSTYNFLPFIEIETNGTIGVQKPLSRFIGHYNISPKLSNSGMKKNRYFIDSALKCFTSLSNVTFKFVVSSKTDIDECLSTYILPLNIANSAVMLMPAASSAKELKYLEPLVIEWCKHYHFRYSSRLHIAIWDKKTGV